MTSLLKIIYCLFQVDATQRLLLEELPPVLVLQLKWFIYDKYGGLQKYVKQVDFDIDLEIGKGQKDAFFA
jgi:ubiquitin carboxyl-terminal hydrolase 10